MGVQDQSAQARDAQRVLVGRYTLGDRLGRGGMGTVWRARDEMLDREVAVKELTVNHLPEEELEILQSRMKREARAAARIKHPGVITIHDVVEQDGRPWIVMELIDGRSLADVISQDGTLLPREAAEVGVQVLAALHRGHQLGVLHRDVKPANVLLEHNTGRVVLLDFGIATFEGSTELTRPGDLVGSPDYLAPERAQGERPGPASDLWGLGATLYAAVEGESPFRRTSPITTLAAVVGDPLPEPRRAGALGPVLAALMAKDPAERPGADEALRMLTEVTAGHTLDIKPVPKVAQKMPTQSVPVVDRSEAAEPAAEEAGQAQSARLTRPTVAAAEPVPAPAQAPAQAEPPATVKPERRKGLRIAVALVVAVVLAGGAAYAAPKLLHHNPTAQDAGPAVSISEAPAPGPAPTGYTWVDDPAGFRFPVPNDGTPWVRTTDSLGQILYSPDGRIHFLQFAVTVGQSLTPREHFLQMEGGITKTLSNYHRENLSDTKVNGHEAASWEFTFVATDGSRRHAKEVEFRDDNGTSYGLYVSAPDKDWITAQRRLTTVLNNFTPMR
ncbi:serine/threonine-protein kinase [Kitasatospora sp. GP82]|uniref:serine/threonine-protein kinase n=1 Tax=Kitasatospora sp. GP82 TaxID=3035089 RepID=UPI002476CCBC|nr:serine/threonine-protein kinase [Kitasatospora sp. GP82]MDH6124228.1 tRNA A-37 threonylcarbamoyl transferase component Bud32 [Kitasatospora sp. GP82]